MNKESIKNESGMKLDYLHKMYMRKKKENFIWNALYALFSFKWIEWKDIKIKIIKPVEGSFKPIIGFWC